MTLSKPTLETLIDLVEIRLGCVEVYDREDARELNSLQQCRLELQTILDGGAPKKPASISARNGRRNPPTRAAHH